MAGGPKYSRFKSFMHDMASKQMKINKETINLKAGRGKYPKCLSEKPYEFCPKEIPKDPENVPKDCEKCPHFLYSKFYFKVYMTHEKQLKMWKKRGLPLVLKSK